MTTQQPNPAQAVATLLKAIIVLVLIGMFAWACLSGTSITSTPTSPPSTPTTAVITPSSATPPPTLLTPTPRTYTPAPTWSPGEADFLLGMHDGFWDWPFAQDPGNDAALVDLGHNTCRTLQTGMSEPDVIDALGRYGPTATLPETERRLFVHTAEVYICPGVHVAP